jgi:hypothetical protein
MIRTENDIWQSLIVSINLLLDDFGLSGFSVLQAYQPTIQGAQIDKAIYISRISKNRIQSQGTSYQNLPTSITRVEGWQVVDNFQFNFIVNEDVNDEDSITPVTAAMYLQALIQSYDFIQLIKDYDISIGFSAQMSENYVIDDKGRYYKDPIVEFSIMYYQSFESSMPFAEILGDVHRV